MKAKQPNILLVMTDQQRWDSLGCYGAEWIETPNLDKLAAGGMVYDKCYVNNPVCTPSRASMFTGKHLPGHGVCRLHDVLPDGEILFPRHLQDLGYRTALFGKLHVSGRIREEAQRHPNDGFDIYEWCMEASISMDSPFNGYSRWLREQNPEFHRRMKSLGRKLTHIPREYHFTRWAAERTIDFIENHNREQPFFCMMSLFDPHNPYDDYPREYAERVDLEKMPMPDLCGLSPGENPASSIRGIAQEQRDGYLGPVDSFSEEDFRQMRIGYYASIALVDDEVGRVLDVLDWKGIAEETLVIFLSDHGDMLGDKGLLVKGAFFYDPCVRVPLIIRQPGSVPAGVRSPALVQPHDLAATILQAAGMKEGQICSLMPESRDIRNAVESCHAAAVCAYRGTGIDNRGRYFDPPIHATMITDGRHKLSLYHPQPGVDRETAGQFFDLQEDPGECRNLWGFRPEKQLELSEELLQWMFLQEKQSRLQVESVEPAGTRLVNNRLR